MDILEFLNNNQIIVDGNSFSKSNNGIYKWDTEAQIDLIVEVQRILMGNRINMLPRIESSIGKEIEGFIVQYKKATKMISAISDKGKKNYFESELIEKGNGIIKRAEKSIEALDETQYLKLISRSMNNDEICLGRVDEGNLKKEQLVITLRTVKYISYNLIEHDCYNYVKRIKRRGYDRSIEDIIKDFSYKAKLEEDSIMYLRVLANYPLEAMKTLLKIKNDKNRFSEDEWIKEINLSQKIDGIELL